ncbi:hypothetical protein [Microcella sp.]|uniref:hypothetical protein n=1 Tax=Microcella sp. TaxID=1913979 RepID=UPI00391A248E
MFAGAWILVIGWLALSAAVAVVLALAIVGGIQRKDHYALPAVGLVAVGLVVVSVTAIESVGLGGLVAQLLIVALAIAGGAPVVRGVLRLADRRPRGNDTTPTSAAGTSAAPAPTVADAAEVLRGGATIGYLERAAVVAAVLLARWEILAVLVAIKSVGRFRDLDAGHHVTERFIIGTLASLLWAGATAALIALA